MELIKPEDPQYFTESSNGLYDRHHYKVISKNGESLNVGSWEEVREIWWNKRHILSHIEVLDIKPKGKGGFV
tara:strand:+ start:146 stop:361 length:216 start_codon:yes stop_codon:yes gene_type:complete